MRLTVVFISLLGFFTSTAIAGNWNSSGNSKYTKHLDSQKTLETTLLACYPYYDEILLIRRLELAGSFMAVSDIQDAQKNMVAHGTNLLMGLEWLMADINFALSEEGKKISSIAGIAEDLFDPDNKDDSGNKVGAKCQKTADAFKVKYPKIEAAARMSALEKMARERDKMQALMGSCKEKFPIQEGKPKNVSEHFTCLITYEVEFP